MNAVREPILSAIVAEAAHITCSTSVALLVDSPEPRCESSDGLPSLSADELSELAVALTLRRSLGEPRMVSAMARSLLPVRLVKLQHRG